MPGLNVVQKITDRSVENDGLLDVGYMAGLFDLKKTRVFDHRLHLAAVCRRRAMGFAAANHKRRSIDFIQPGAVVEPR